jgi:hypothetical protein
MTAFNAWANINNIAALRALATASVSNADVINVIGYHNATITSAPDGGGGLFVYDSTDTASADDGGIIIVDAVGRRWKRQYSGPVNLGWFGAVGDGVTDNQITWQAFQQIVPKLTKTIPQTVTITIASPGIISLTNHGFQPGTPVVFNTTAALPTGLTVGAPYWVTFANWATNSFSVSAIGFSTGYVPDPAPVNTSGSQSGVHSISALGQDWIDIYLPPGNYVAPSGYSNTLTQNGCKKVRLSAYGATTNNFTWNDQSLYNMQTGEFDTANTAPINSQGTNINQIFVTLSNLADVPKFRVGQWVLMMALDVQGAASYPPNNHYFEYKQITSINTGTGQIFFNQRTRNPYKSTYPTYGAGGVGTFPSGG